jgi:1-acyl-sn-glycerol-3-phosphate acyltransferase
MTQTVPVSASPVNAPSENAAPERAPRKSGRRAHGAAVAEAARPENRLPIRLLQAFDVCFARIYHRITVLSPQRLPKHGPAILICNHVSGLDPMLIQAVCPRLIVWMMAREYYEIPVLRTIFKTVEAIPVDRGGRDLAATRAALRALEAGRILGVFPEGKIETTHDLLPFQTGVALMALKANVPVYPAYLDGTQRGKAMVPAVLRRNVACVAFGPPLEYPAASTSKEVLQEVTDHYVGAVETLRATMERAFPGSRAQRRA